MHTYIKKDFKKDFLQNVFENNLQKTLILVNIANTNFMEAALELND